MRRAVASIWFHSSVSGGSRSRVPRTAFSGWILLAVWLIADAVVSVSVRGRPTRIGTMLRSLRFVAAAVLLVADLHAVTVRLTADDGDRVQLAVHPGDVLRIELAAQPAEGKQWGVSGHVPP